MDYHRRPSSSSSLYSDPTNNSSKSKKVKKWVVKTMSIPSYPPIPMVSMVGRKDITSKTFPHSSPVSVLPPKKRSRISTITTAIAPTTTHKVWCRLPPHPDRFDKRFFVENGRSSCHCGHKKPFGIQRSSEEEEEEIDDEIILWRGDSHIKTPPVRLRFESLLPSSSSSSSE